jgi:hypothetical protein
MDNLEDEKIAELVWKQLHLKEDSIFVDLFQVSLQLLYFELIL